MHSADNRGTCISRNYLVQTIKRITAYSIYSNVVVSSAAAFLSAGFAYTYFQNNWLIYGFLVFFATLTVYTFQRLYKAETSATRSSSLEWVRDHTKQQVVAVFVSGCITVLLLIYVVQKNLLIGILVLALGSVSMAYVVPVFGKSFRDVPYLKSPVVAFVWTVFLFVFPALNEGISMEIILWQVMAFFVFFIALTIPFDLRDADLDDPRQKTLPMLIGTKMSKVVATVLISGTGFIFALFNDNLRFNFLFYAAIGLLLVLILFTTPKRSIVFFAALDATLALLGLAYFV